MRVEQRVWTPRSGWTLVNSDGVLTASLVIFFAAPGTLDDGTRYADLRSFYPAAPIIGCTTGGEIVDAQVRDDTIVATAIEFSATDIILSRTTVSNGLGSFAAGCELAAALPPAGLRGVFVLSDGTRVNGTDLVAGLRDVLGRNVVLTGGLAGDGANFGSTRVGLDENPLPGRVVAAGFYGNALTLGNGSVGGWDAVGPERLVTRAEGNTLFDLDGEPALDLYKQYLGPEAAHLPASALLCPLRVHPPGHPEASLVRTVVGIDERRKAMTFAGNIPQGHVAQVMLGHFDNLVAGAGRAATKAMIPNARLAILVSCIGRKLLMGQQIADEVEAVAEVLGEECRVTGFYSYGEIAPLEQSATCDLHNQTMTITTFAET